MKKKIIGVIIVVVIVAIAIYFYKKNKKAKENEALMASDTAKTLAAQTATSSANTSTLKSTVTVPTNVVASNPNPAAKIYPYSAVIRDGSRGMAIIQYQPLTDYFKVGDSILIASGPYMGTHKIWNIYSFSSGGTLPGAGQNLYIEKAYSSADKGSFSKA